MIWNKLSEEDKNEYSEIFKVCYGDTIIKIPQEDEPEYCDEELIFHTSPELLEYFITNKRIEKIEKIKKGYVVSR